MNFLNEETGELGRAIRTVEIGRDHPGEVAEDKSVAMDNLKEELADVLDQVLIVADKYDVTPEELFEQSESKLKGRFK